MRFPFQRNELEIVYAALATGHVSNRAASANEMLSWLPDDAGDWAIIVGTLALCYRYLLDYRTKREAARDLRQERESDRLFRLVTQLIEKTAKLDAEDPQASRIVRVVREESGKASRPG